MTPLNEFIGTITIGAVLGVGGGTLLPQDPVTRDSLRVAAHLCARNGDVDIRSGHSFDGLINVKTIQNRGKDRLAVTCANGAFFYETIEWIEKEEPKEPAAPETGSGKPPNT